MQAGNGWDPSVSSSLFLHNEDLVAEFLPTSGYDDKDLEVGRPAMNVTVECWATVGHHHRGSRPIYAHDGDGRW
jgi:hypothetical protein